MQKSKEFTKFGGTVFQFIKYNSRRFVNLIVKAIPLNKTVVCFLLVIAGGLIGASALLLMTPKSVYTPKEVQVIMTIVDEGVNHDQSLQMQYPEKNPAAIYLERRVNWIEVEKEDQINVFMETWELKIENVSFTDTVGDGSGDDLIVVSFTNVGTCQLTFSQVNFNGVTQTGNWELTSGEDKIGAGESDTVQITVDWTPGNNYSIEFVTTDGKAMGSGAQFTCTA